MGKLFNLNPTSTRPGLLRSRHHARPLGATDGRLWRLLRESRRTRGKKNSLSLIGEAGTPGTRKEMMPAHL